MSQGKPLLIYGPRYFLRRLRDLGFQTWHQFWDESYDDLEGYPRWLAMRSVAQHIRATYQVTDTPWQNCCNHNLIHCHIDQWLV